MLLQQTFFSDFLIYRFVFIKAFEIVWDLFLGFFAHIVIVQGRSKI